MNNNISTELYRAFYGVGLHMSFSKAAKAAGVSQSAVSQSVKQLEKELNLTLFERTTKSVDFTADGKILFDTVARAFSILDDGVIQLQAKLNHNKDSLRLAASDTLCRHYLLEYFKKWQEQYPETGLQINNRPSPKCVEAVRGNKAHLAVVNIYDSLLTDNQMETVGLIQLHDIFIAGPAYKKKKKCTIDELMAEPMLLLEVGSASRGFFNTLLKGYQKEPDFELGSLDVLLDLVRINMGVSLVPREFVQEDLKAGRLIELRVPIDVPTRQVGVVRSRMAALPESASNFIQMLTETK